MKNLLLLLFISLYSVCWAQQIPFQGRLIENGVPVSGTRFFTFTINEVSWTESHANVVVTNGLYSLTLGSGTAIPKTLFTDRETVLLKVQVNNNPIDEVVLHKPIGQVGEYVNDTDIKFDGKVGINTQEPKRRLHVNQNGPTLALEGTTSTFIEFYPLGYNLGRKAWLGFGSENTNTQFYLRNQSNGPIVFSTNNEAVRILANGNVGIGISDAQQKLDILGGIRLGNTTTDLAGSMRWTGTDFEGHDGSSWVSLTKGGDAETFTVGDETEQYIYSISQNAENGAVTTQSVWQSFIATNSAPLYSFGVSFATPTSTNIRIRLYEGQGTTGQVFYTETFPASQFNGNLSWRTLSLAANANINLESGKLYTLFIEGVSGNVTFSRHTGNLYPYGRMSTGASYDLKFNVRVTVQDTYNFEVDASGATVGGDLEAEGRIKDLTGFVAPVGSVIAYAATVTPEGWLRCDGAPVSRVKYKDLFDIIGTSWGAGDGSTTFNLPDLRGQFLRGVAYSTSNDPDKGSRTAKYSGGATGNQVGSYQGDELKSHQHIIPPGGAGHYNSFYGTHTETQSVAPYAGGPVGGYKRDLTSSVGGSENRPKNAYVNYIIKY